LDRDAANGRNAQLVEVADRDVDLLRNRAEPVVGSDRRRVARRERRYERIGLGFRREIPLQIVPGTERAARAGEQHHTHRIVHLCLDEGLDEVALQRMRHSIETLGPVETDLCDTWRMHLDFEAGKETFAHDFPPPFEADVARAAVSGQRVL